MRLSLDAFGDQQLSRTLLRFRHAADDMTPVLEDIERDFYDIEREQFDSEGSRSTSWAPLSTTYVAWKAHAFPGTKILEREATLKESLTGGSGGLRRLTNDHLEVIGAPHGEYHQRGTRRMPRRRPVDLTSIDKRRWVRMIQSHLIAAERGYL